MMNEQPTRTCPCGSGVVYDACCGKYHAGMPAPTAEALMRSRYTAYATGNTDYIIKTTWPCQQISLEGERSMLETSNTHWLRLEVSRTVAGNKSDLQGEVEFTAWYIEPPSTVEQPLHEVSKFIKENGDWYYVNPGLEKKPVAKKLDIGRNDPCFCGSGKKYKKCCGSL